MYHCSHDYFAFIVHWNYSSWRGAVLLTHITKKVHRTRQEHSRCAFQLKQLLKAILSLRSERCHEICNNLFQLSISRFADDIFLGDGGEEIFLGWPESNKIYDKPCLRVTFFQHLSLIYLMWARNSFSKAVILAGSTLSKYPRTPQ